MTGSSIDSSQPEAREAAQPSLFTTLTLEQLRRRLICLAIKLVWNRDDAEELVQEAFKIALTHGLKTGEDRFGPWMARTVANLCLNARRRRRPEPLAPWLDVETATTPLDRVGQAEQLERLREAVGRLPEQQRVALVLRTMEQMDYGEIARVMQITASAVRTHVHLARQHLADMFRAQEQADGRSPA